METYPKVHPRMQKRKLANIEYGDSLVSIVKKYDLTLGEIITMLSENITRLATHLKLAEDKKRNELIKK